MSAYCYILHSVKLNRFYIGSTVLEVNKRLEKHLNHYYGSTKFTAKADDWELFVSIECDNLDQARSIERHIKRMKSQKYLENLKRYPEIVGKLKSKYPSHK